MIVTHKTGGSARYEVEEIIREGKKSWMWQGQCACCRKPFSFKMSVEPDKVTPYRVCKPCLKTPRGQAEALFSA
jgi:hypothetical protein